MVLPILFIIIIVYGSGVARIRSALLFFLYTFSGSLFMLLAILQIYSFIGSTDFQLISLYEISLDSQKILWLSLSFSKRSFSNVLYKPFSQYRIPYLTLIKFKGVLALTNRFYHSDSNYNQFNLNPVKVYENADISKFDIISYNKNKSGIATLNPFFISGFCDGESTFVVSIVKKKVYSLGWYVKLRFAIALHYRDLPLLKQIQSFFGVGKITQNENSNEAAYCVESVKDLNNVIIPHFILYPFLTQKRADFQLFKLIVNLINKKEHLTLAGLEKIISIKASINLGLSDKLIEYFPNIIPIERPTVELKEITNNHWLAGFSDAEGCFSFYIAKSNTTKTGKDVRLRFSISQHSRDYLLLVSFIKYFNCGNVQLHKNSCSLEFRVNKFSDINEKIIPFFIQYPLNGYKNLDFLDFCEVAKIINKKEHLTTNGLELIQNIKLRISKRKINGNHI
jgi:LAGLIDADG endonuclease/Proton-conducting membrane transporter